ncbi:hypothetical protein NSTC731_04639 [Nostoc sp. DSM 114167]|jgi:hypothetical protein
MFLQGIYGKNKGTWLIKILFLIIAIVYGKA